MTTDAEILKEWAKNFRDAETKEPSDAKDPPLAKAAIRLYRLAELNERKTWDCKKHKMLMSGCEICMREREADERRKMRGEGYMSYTEDEVKQAEQRGIQKGKADLIAELMQEEYDHAIPWAIVKRAKALESAEAKGGVDTTTSRHDVIVPDTPKAEEPPANPAPENAHENGKSIAECECKTCKEARSKPEKPCKHKKLFGKYKVVCLKCKDKPSKRKVKE